MALINRLAKVTDGPIVQSAGADVVIGLAVTRIVGIACAASHEASVKLGSRGGDSRSGNPASRRASA
jgi:hypothetical protein